MIRNNMYRFPRPEEVYDLRLDYSTAQASDLPYGSYMIAPGNRVWYKDHDQGAWVQVGNELTEFVLELAHEKKYPRAKPKVESEPTPEHYGDF